MNLELFQDILKKKIILKRNEYLKLPGKVDSNIYFIESGSLKISIENEDSEQIIRFGYDGNIIVSLDSFITGKASDFSIQAIKKTELWQADKKDFFQKVYSSPENMKIYIQIIEDLILQQMERERDLLIESPKERYLRVFKRNPKLFQIIPNKHIANYLRMSPETYSRLKKS